MMIDQILESRMITDVLSLPCIRSTYNHIIWTLNLPLKRFAKKETEEECKYSKLLWKSRNIRKYTFTNMVMVCLFYIETIQLDNHSWKKKHKHQDTHKNHTVATKITADNCNILSWLSISCIISLLQDLITWCETDINRF